MISVRTNTFAMGWTRELWKQQRVVVKCREKQQCLLKQKITCRSSCGDVYFLDLHASAQY